MNMQITNCKACGASCVWAITTKGQKMLVNAAPSENGNVKLEPRTEGPEPLAIVISTLPAPPGTVLHTSHFADCPQAAKFRKSTKRSRSW